MKQAKGKLTERLDMDQAFNLLRDLARARTRRLSDLARAFVNGSDSLMGVTADKLRRRTGQGLADANDSEDLPPREYTQTAHHA